MPARTIVVLGGALSGPTAAARARETDPFARIIILERSRDVSYAGCALAYHVSGEVPLLDSLNQEKADFFDRVYGIEVRTGVEITRIDPGARSVHWKGGSEKYDSLVYATGAQSIAPRHPSLRDAANVLPLRNLKDLEAVMALLANGARRVAILGGGFFGIEAADAFLRRGSEVTIVERGPGILPRFSESLSGTAAEALRAEGARIHAGTVVTKVGRTGGLVQGLTLRNGISFETDLVISASGLRPRTGLLRKAGAKLNPDGTVKVDARCATSLPRIFACGVCVSLPHIVSGKPIWFAQASQADKTAQVAGANAAGGTARMGAVTGTALLRAGRVTIGGTGLGLEESAVFAGKKNLGVSRIHAPSCDVFFPGSSPLSVELYYDTRSGRLLGAQVAGSSSADKRLDVLATAVAAGLTVEQLAGLDLAYEPPYSTARDPINVAGAVGSADRSGMAMAWSVSDLSSKKKTVSIVDVRAPAERRSGMISGSTAIGLSEILSGKGAFRKGRTVVFVSGTGRRAYLAARLAERAGIRKAGYLSGGLASWVSSGKALSAK